MAARETYKPASLDPNKKIPSSFPRHKKIGTHTNATIKEALNAEFILALIFGIPEDEGSFEPTIFAEISGITAVAMAPTKVLGIIMRGKAIPDAIPNKLIARSFVIPQATSRRGIIIAIKNVPSEEAVLMVVIGVEDLSSGTKEQKGDFAFPP